MLGDVLESLRSLKVFTIQRLGVSKATNSPNTASSRPNDSGKLMDSTGSDLPMATKRMEEL